MAPGIKCCTCIYIHSLLPTTTHLVDARNNPNCERYHTTQALLSLIKQSIHSCSYYAGISDSCTCREANPPAGTHGEPVENLSRSALSSSLRLLMSFQNHCTALSDTFRPQYFRHECMHQDKVTAILDAAVHSYACGPHPSVSLPVIDINFWHTRYQQHQLTGSEYPQTFLWQNLQYST